MLQEGSHGRVFFLYYLPVPDRVLTSIWRGPLYFFFLFLFDIHKTRGLGGHGMREEGVVISKIWEAERVPR